jgi:ribosome recycling factor
MSEMIEETLAELSTAIVKAHEALKRDLTKLRTGRANASMLDGVRVDYYGVPTPISQMATVSVPEARMLTVKPWEKGQAKAIEKAIVEANLGLNPQTDGDFIRIPMPALTEERRKDLVKIARKNGEETKVAIRKARHEAKDMLAALEADGDASQDDVERGLERVEKLVEAGGAEVDAIVTRKEKDILEV